MKVVLLFFCTIIGIVLFTILIFLFSSLRLNIKRVKITNIENETKKSKLDKEILIYLELYLFGKIKILKINLNKKVFERLNVNPSIQDFRKSKEILKNTKKLKIIDILSPNVKRLNLELELGTEDVILTTFLVTLFSSVLGILLSNLNHKDVRYSIKPMYKFGNSVNLRLNCIISVKIVHIIYAIYILLKKGMIKNERASNRRSYDYSYE